MNRWRPASESHSGHSDDILQPRFQLIHGSLDHDRHLAQCYFLRWLAYDTRTSQIINIMYCKTMHWKYISPIFEFYILISFLIFIYIYLLCNKKRKHVTQAHSLHCIVIVILYLLGLRKNTTFLQCVINSAIYLKICSICAFILKQF